MVSMRAEWIVAVRTGGEVVEIGAVKQVDQAEASVSGRYGRM